MNKYISKSLLITIVFLNLIRCLPDNSGNQGMSTKEEREFEQIQIPPMYGECLCKSLETFDPFWCDTTLSEKYLISIMPTPFRFSAYSFNVIVDSFEIKKVLFSEKFVSLLSDTSFNNYLKINQVCQTHPYDSTIHIRVHSNPNRIIDLPKIESEKLYHFLHEKLWNLKDFDQQGNYQESWAISGKKGNEFETWERKYFNDTIFYNQIQMLLNRLEYSIYNEEGSLKNRLEIKVGKDNLKSTKQIRDLLYVDSIFKEE